MSREVQHDGIDALIVRFPFDRQLVDLIKTLPNRRWNQAERFWRVPEDDVVRLVELLQPARFRFDSTTLELYRRFGGATLLLDMDPPPYGSDQLESAAGSRAAPGDYTVSALNEQIQQALEAAFPTSVWLVGEISSYNRSAHKQHVTFKLVELDARGQSVSCIDATLFADDRRVIEGQLEAAGWPFRLEDEVQVRVRVRVRLHVPWGCYRAVVEDLDLNYTLGETARRREEIVRRLTERGLVGRNTSLSFPRLPLRVGLVTSLGSDAYNDVVRTLRESGFAFDISVHGARVQGRATEPSVLNALDWFAARAASFDVVLICRGGGSRTDLVWFDSEELGQAVACFPLPVIIGIGHEQDHSVLDAVGWRCKTPTAAAELLVQTVRSSLERLEQLTVSVLSGASRKIALDRRRGMEQGRRLTLGTRALLRRESAELGERRRRAARGARAMLVSAREWLSRRARDIPRGSWVHLGRQRTFLENARRSIAQGARRDLGAARHRLDQLARVLGPRAARVLSQAAERTESKRRRLELADPRRVLERGYCILRLADGPLLVRPAQAPPGTALRAQLRGGELGLLSTGSAPGPEDGRQG